MQDQVIIQDQNEFFTIAHKNTFSRIDITLLNDHSHDKVKMKVLVSSRDWKTERTKEQLKEILKLTNCHDLENMLDVVNEKGPATEVLFFIDYFNNFGKSPQQHVQNMLLTQGYTITSFNILNKKVEIDEDGATKQIFDIQINLIILSM